MVKPINWSGMLEPYLQPLKERLGMLPLGQYEDGSVRLAWPGMLADTFSKGMAAAETPIPAINDDQAWADKSAAMFDMTSLAPMAGAGVAMTGALDNALGSAGGNLMKGAPRISLKGSNGLAQIMRGDEPIGYVKYGVDGDAATIHDIKTYDGSNALGLSGLRELREAFREIAPDVKTFQGVREPTMKTGAARQGADASGYGERKQSVDLFSNAKQGAAVPAGMEAAQPQGIRAYHGSPHDFDRFSLDKIGTGEGAQAYGHGLYFADSEDVARAYRDSLSPDGLGQVARGRLRQFNGDMDKTIEYLQQRAAGNADSDAPFAVNNRQALAELEAAKAQGITLGRMYEVNIKANPEDFLDWDKPLSQQSERVRQAALEIRNAAARKEYEARGFPPNLIEEYLGNAAKADKTGGQLVQGMKGADLSSDFSQALREAGIPGIRYLDGMSRQNVDVNELRGTVSMWERAARKSPNDAYAQQMLADAQKALADAEKPLSSNYVVFDDALIDILRKYANAPTGAAIPAGMEAAQSDDPQTMTTANILRLLMGGK